MDLKLKDEITKLLIESPGMSISQLAKKTKNYYSYTHKILSNMEKQKLITIEKVTKGKRKITICRLADEYKHAWVKDVNRFFRALIKDAEVKTAFLLMYGFLIFTLFTRGAPQGTLAMAMEASDLVTAPVQPFNYGLIIAIVIPVLLVIWFLRKRY